ncbi:MAG: sulfatase family protein [Solirubrobacterales bacterium]
MQGALRPRRRAGAVLFAVLAAACLLAAIVTGESSRASHGGPPHVVFITTDDQTVQDMLALPLTQTHVGANGVTFDNAYVSFPLCCPSRATYLTGQYAHNHEVLANVPPEGGYPKLRDAQTLPVWLQAAGYRTVHIGKMPNGFGEDPTYVPPGWREPNGEFYGYLPDPPSAYFGFKLNENGVPTQYSSTDYQTDVYADKAVEAIDSHLANPATRAKPLYLEVQFFAPHDPADPAPRHAGFFASAPLPHDESFNEKDFKDKPKWLRRVKRMGGGLRSKVQDRYRKRLESLLAVDEAVNRIVSMLAIKGILNETYIIFTSDNGYMQGQHRLHQGKFVAYDPSAKVPLLLRGPGLPTGVTSSELVSNVDIVKTILDMSGASPQITVDGRSMLPFALDPERRTRRPLLFETGPPVALADAVSASAAGKRRRRRSKRVKNLDLDRTAQLSGRVIKPPKYRALRTEQYLLIKYADGGRELYDMEEDELQTNSVWDDPRYRKVRKWMLKRIKKFTRCQGEKCNRKLAKPPKPLPERKGKGGGRKR